MYIDFHNHAYNSPPPDGVFQINSIPPAAVKQLRRPHHNEWWTLEHHPWYIAAALTALPEEFAQLAQQPEIAGIGEAGLDWRRGGDAATQLAAFRAVIAVAEAVKKPLFVHCVHAHSELLRLYKQLRWQVPTVIHYFCGKPELARQLWQKGFYLSLAPLSLENPRLVAALREAPEQLALILLETDDPEHGDIAAHYAAAAAQLGCSLDSLQERMQKNLSAIFFTKT